MIRTWLGAALAASIAAGPASAHRVAAAATEVTWNARTSTLEVVHRLHAGDVEDALAARGAPADLSTLASQVHAARLVAQGFALTVDGAPRTLDTLGATVEGPTVFVLQEVAMAEAPERVAPAKADFLIPDFSAQTNTVTVRLGEATTTWRFTRCPGSADQACAGPPQRREARALDAP